MTNIGKVFFSLNGYDKRGKKITYLQGFINEVSDDFMVYYDYLLEQAKLNNSSVDSIHIIALNDIPKG